METLFQYSSVSPWDGRPPNCDEAGWHVLGVPHLTKSASTGVMVFLSHWCPKTQCWGTDHDRRPPSWAVQQKLAYLGFLQDAHQRINVEKLG